MGLVIQKLSLALKASYLDFFDHRAFSDKNPNGPCYCTSPNMDKAREAKMVSEFGNDIKGTIRSYAVKMLEEEAIHGYLAFMDDLAIGWCNAHDMDTYKAFVPEQARQGKIGKTLSVVCFQVAPDYRGQGVATELLNHVCQAAKAEGYLAVEGYVTLGQEGQRFDYTGPYALYNKLGFVEALRTDRHIIMRKLVGSA